MFEAVFFDLYETLITEFDPDWKPGPTLAERLGIDEQVCRKEWNARSKPRMTGRIPDFPTVLRQICESDGKPVNNSVIEELYQERLNIKAVPFERVEDEVLQTLQKINDLGLKIGLISNCSSEEVTAWNSSKLAAFFDSVTFSCDVGLCKPDPEIYLTACSRLNVSPSKCIFIGDGGSNELVGAVEVGMQPYWATWFLDRWPTGVRTINMPSIPKSVLRLETFDNLVQIITSLMTSDDYK